jgi:hypothetical protein
MKMRREPLLGSSTESVSREVGEFTEFVMSAERNALTEPYGSVGPR